MKRVIFVVTVLLSLCMPGKTEKDPLRMPVYFNNEAKCTFRIPSGWEEIPQATIRQINANIQNLTGKKERGIAAGFWKSAEKSPESAVTVSVTKGRVVWKDFLKGYGNTAKLTEELKKDFSILENTSVGKPLVDDKRKMVLFPASYGFTNKAQVSGTILAACGNGTLVTVYFPEKSGGDPDVAAFKKSVFDSFAFAKGYEYGARPKGSLPTRPVVCGIIGGLVALLVTGRQKAKEKKRKKAAEQAASEKNQAE